MAKKIKDLAVATGTYRNSFNEEKRRYMNCGAVMEGDDGGMFIMLNKYIDYGAIPSQGDSLLISAFDMKDREQKGTPTKDELRREIDSAPGAALDDDMPEF